MLFVLRMLMMGVHFIGAGILGLLLGLCRPFHPDNSRLCARLYSLPALRLLRIKVQTDTRNLAEHDRPCVIIANHQSNYDLYVIGCVVPRRTVSIGKKSLKWVPLFGQLYWLAGNVLIDRGNARKAKRSMLATTHTLQHENTSIWVFPEGTRNGGGEMLPFKKGAFQMAVAAGVPIIPVCASSYVRSLRLNAWNSGRVMIRSLPEIPTAGLSMDDLPQLIETCRSRMQTCIDAMDAELASTSTPA
ncbi:1-acyl-sn-glycerol-3-phosphate acyltransferase [Pseudomonas sp. BIGb0408]|uniref:1-acyl-sn-glycerol-3-phosphate acyltransferase n=1 Tax=Phytopseudomonas flavescens TaxID=29435 RepID=A0A7Z0BME7_9GAMM|nr:MULTISPECIES: 1-acyl-sn-glycerol-3-phosphate acyltransferase [Pseudomonas]MCW2293033.1 1-acyl-sn-glycerol-3-phosphate acyltransferase [Pseudomonas sp. BIGb0408]NYH72397.1 1-acyl-sn-glycerol-3-phosphate acyltransferase [Pseudomonas flavescens]